LEELIINLGIRAKKYQLCATYWYNGEGEYLKVVVVVVFVVVVK
jgi:hypothetical protein